MPAELRHIAVIAHLASGMTVLPLGFSPLVLRKGVARHRVVGWLWCGLMTFTALVSFALHGVNPRGLSPVHLFSVLTLILFPVIIYQARTGHIAGHQQAALGLMIGVLVIAGVFTFLPDRILGELVARIFSRVFF